MWIYEKKLQYPVRIKTPNARTAHIIVSQLGGPDGELGASMRYLNQRYEMPYRDVAGMLTDIGTEELAHLEIVAAILHQLTADLTPDQIAASPLAAYFTDHTVGVYPMGADGMPFNARAFAVKGDVITDLNEDLAAEQKARTTYENLIRLVDDPDVLDPLRYLREREIVHYQRFGDALTRTQERLDSRNFYAINPAYDRAK